MGLRRTVLDQVPAFDPELGPGALGFGDDDLFGWQLIEAGFKVQYIDKAIVYHHFDESRLRREAWLDAARKRGKTEAYIRYHWFHEKIKFPHLKWLYYYTKLSFRRVLQPPPGLKSEGCPLWEISYVKNLEKNKQLCHEIKRPRCYSIRGLKKSTPASVSYG